MRIPVIKGIRDNAAKVHRFFPPRLVQPIATFGQSGTGIAKGTLRMALISGVPYCMGSLNNSFTRV